MSRGLKAQIAGTSLRAESIGAFDDLWIKERCSHVKQCACEQNALTGLVLCPYLALAGHVRPQKLAPVIRPEGRLRSQRKQYSVTAIEHQMIGGVKCDRILRKPY